MKDLVCGTILGAICLYSTVALAQPGDAPGIDEMWRIIQAQQARIEELERRLASTADEVVQTSERMEATVAHLESGGFAAAGQEPRVHLGGYGELHYSDYDDAESIDLHRFVLFVGYQFTDTLRLFSEIEIEHSIAGEGKPGEVEVEQALVRWQYSDRHFLDMGLFLLPVGILNETHEPPAFYGVERNAVEKNIIPATWWEGGILAGGEIAPGWRYDFAVHSGLRLDTGNASAAKRTSIRSARQKVGEADASDFAYTGRLRFSGVQGLQVGVTVQYQPDLTQDDAAGIGLADIDGLLFEADLALQRGPLHLRALYAAWSIDDAINLLNPGADRQRGWYVEPAWRVSDRLGFFGRYSRYDLTAGGGGASVMRAVDFGVNYWLDPRFVIKADFQRQDNDGAGDSDGFNIGVGYEF